MALVVPGVARFTVNQTLESRSVVNVLDYRIDTTGSTMSREEAVDNQAGSIIEQWADTVLTRQVEDLSLVSVTYVDLNTADGVTGVRVSGGGTTLPASGALISPPLPGNTSALITKQAPSARGRRNGRIFMAGINEDGTENDNGNRLTAAWVTATQAEWDTFLANTNEVDSLGTAFSSDMCVVHVTSRDTEGNPLTGDFSVVQELVLDNLLATQRRRLRG